MIRNAAEGNIFNLQSSIEDGHDINITRVQFLFARIRFNGNIHIFDLQYFKNTDNWEEKYILLEEYFV